MWWSLGANALRDVCSGWCDQKIAYMGNLKAVVGVSPLYPFPDASGHAMQAPMEPTYDVRFKSRDLWPDSCDDALNHVGVFQSYLEKAETT